MSADRGAGHRETSDEQRLVEGLLRRDPVASREFLERFRGLFYHTITSFEANRSRRDDCFQILSVHTFELLQRGRYHPHKGPFGPWLHRVLWCRAIDVIRKKEAKRQVRLHAVGVSPPDQPAEADDPSALLSRDETLTIVNRVLGGLPPIDREVLRLRIVEDATHEQVAAELRLTLDQAKYRLKKAMASLRRELEARLVEPLA